MNINDFIRGWFIGNFEPSILKTKDFEIGYQTYKKGYVPDLHYQRIATEYNLVVEGSLVCNGKTYKEGDFFIFEPYVVCELEFLEDSKIVCIKVPSIPKDKINC